MSFSNLSLKALGLSLLVLAVQAQDRTTEAGEAGVKDPTAECTPYNYPPVSAKAASFPPIWQPATLVAGDTVAAAKWASIQSKIPNIAVKGTPAGATNITYGADDPDCWWTRTQCVTSKLAGIPPDVSNVPEPNTLGYGFDDGPNCSHNAFYDYLTTQKQKATMFYIGSNVMDWPLEAQRGVVDGHEVCVHTWSHRYLTGQASADAFAELYYTMEAIKLVTGVTPTCFRPPFGDIDDRIRAIATALGLRTILWKYDTFDWEHGTNGITPAIIDGNYAAVIAAAKNGTFNNAGAIMLTHEIDNFTMQEAINQYPALKAAFKYLVPVGVAYNVTQPYVETNYSLPSFAQYTAGTVQTSGAPANGSAVVGANSTSTGSKSGTGTGTGSGAQATGGALRSLWDASALVALLIGTAVLL